METAESRPLIAIVDDEVASAQLLSMHLQNEYDTCIATTGAEALIMISSRQPNVVLLDIMLPDISGYEVCITLKSQKETSKIPVIFVTGLEESENEELGFEAGAVDYLNKPIKPQIMKARLARILDNTMYIEFLENMVTQRELTIGALRKEAKEMLERTGGGAT